MAASTSTSADLYDVFINYRGPDVKKTLASHLYRRLILHGLRVFIDYKELNVGENFESEIKGAIKSASVHVAIFSQRYAESKWCLDELQLMLESGSPIIPVFYKVKPADLRCTRGKDGVYARALLNLEKKRPYDSQPRYDSKTIENWRNALSTVSMITGLELDGLELNGDEGELVDKVVECVRQRVKKPQLDVAKYPTGLEEKAQDFERKVLSQQHSGRVQVVGSTAEESPLWQGKSQVPLQLRELRVFSPLSNIPMSIGKLKHLERIVLHDDHDGMSGAFSKWSFNKESIHSIV